MKNDLDFNANINETEQRNTDISDSDASRENTENNYGKNSENSTLHTKKHLVFSILFVIFLALNTTILVVAYWIKKTYYINLTALVYTIFGNNTGTGGGTISSAVWFCLPFILISVAAGLAIVFLNKYWRIKSNGSDKFQRLYLIERVCLIVLLILYFFFDLAYIERKYGVFEFLRNKNGKTTLYEENYVFPKDVKIESDEKRNLIYIYLESMESSYASREAGGLNDENYIPYLTRLANENVSFSDTEKLGGARQIDRAGWTIASMFATTTGIPWALPVGGNGYGNVDFKFASGVYALGDFLHEQGYTQEFLCGSDVRFAGTDKFFKGHGDYKLFDLYTAREKKYIPDDYFVFWGYEDSILYKIAKDEIKNLAAEGKPFNFTMTTIDTHAKEGYVCSECKNEFDGNKTANVIACADKQLYDFVEWIKGEDFYENTTIVITGDHLRMDKFCVGSDDEYDDRRIYNCFINSAHKDETDLPVKNRTFTVLDLFPTALSALGYEIDGDALGLGVNLFSGKNTLPEQMGFEKFDAEHQKQSDFYVRTFAPEFLKDDKRTSASAACLQLEKNYKKRIY